MEEDYDRIIEGMEMVFVELPKFKPQSAAVGKMHRLWLRFMTEVNESTSAIPQELLDDPAISKAISIVERGAYSDEQLATYDKYRDMAATEKALMDGSFNKGREEGEAIGLVKGRAEGEAIGLEKGAHAKNIENARKMKAKGYPIEDIADITGLSSPEVEAL